MISTRFVEVAIFEVHVRGTRENPPDIDIDIGRLWDIGDRKAVSGQ